VLLFLGDSITELGADHSNGGWTARMASAYVRKVTHIRSCAEHWPMKQNDARFTDLLVVTSVGARNVDDDPGEL
jgi:hypothetical protein